VLRANQRDGYSPSYSAHSSDSETTIVQRTDFEHRFGVTNHPFT
jgi:hypothetical protein